MVLKIAAEHVRQVQLAKAPDDLHDPVQKAIELEHATIPAYLCALYTLRPGFNQVVAEIIRSVAREEMLHMAIACNLLIALGGAPAIDKKDFIPVYPGPLPMHIGEGLIVPLAKATVELVQNVFMVIEAPEDPIPCDAAIEQDYATIGQFYRALEKKILELGDRAFHPEFFPREVVNSNWFHPDENFLIDGPDSAVRALQIIVRQGEGTPKSPLGLHHQPAHYYRFKQIPRGRRLVYDPGAPDGYSFTGPVVALDPRGVWNMQPNPDPKSLPEGSRARHVSFIFANAYTRLLGLLHQAFNGDPGAIDRAIALMYDLRLLAQRVLSIPLPDHPELSTGLPFCYQPTL
jgi:Ferritin-like